MVRSRLAVLDVAVVTGRRYCPARAGSSGAASASVGSGAAVVVVASVVGVSGAVSVSVMICWASSTLHLAARDVVLRMRHGLARGE